MKFHSQVGQDLFLFENFFRGKRGGTFVDVGAYDGEKFSNSLFFECSMGWRGLCVEPLPLAFAKLAATRRAICEQCCCADFEGEADFIESEAGVDEQMLSGLEASFDPRHELRLQRVATARTVRTVKVRRLSSLLETHRLFDIDYCSIDTEGAEIGILSELDLQRFRISLFTVENNYDDERIPRLMEAKGYDFVTKLEQDYVFKRPDIQRLAHTTVICAVWHGDPARWDRLRGHMANLARQTVPVDSIYVFDGGDSPPDWLTGRSVTLREPATIYQAWNVALSLVATPFVMNLNLDDRLAPDAVQWLEGAARREKAYLVGGDWKICYAQDETDDVQASYPVDRLPFVAPWPPAVGTPTRLGSGTGERGTFGPAVLWRMEAHLGAPRYPWRLADGSLIRTVGDSVWWSLLGDRLKKKIIRIPIVIGNYYSHPNDQAEFRVLPEDERLLIGEPGVGML